MHGDRLIAIDLGGTIEDTWLLKRAWSASRGFQLSSLPLSRAEVIHLIDGNETLYLEMVNCIYSDRSILRHSLCAGCEEALRMIARDYRISLLSSRPPSQRDATLRWLHKVGISHLITGLALIGSDESKLGWCERHDTSILVDDDIRHLQIGRGHKQTIRIHYDAGNHRLIPEKSQIVVASTWAEIVCFLNTLHEGSSKMRLQDARPGVPNNLAV